MALSYEEMERLDMFQQGEARGWSSGRASERGDIARNMLAENMSSEQIQRLTGLTADEISQLKSRR